MMFSLLKKEKKSAVAGILDKNGGLRVVVTQRWRMGNHLKKGERLFVLPDFLVQEPVPWNEQYDLISRVQQYVQSQIAPVNKCGGCRACCITPYIKEDDFEKPSHTQCRHCTATGCGQYLTRPKACRTFECDWLKSQATDQPMVEELRPDKCGVFFTSDTTDNDPLIFECHVDHMTEQANHYINDEQTKGRKAKLITFYRGEDKA